MFHRTHCNTRGNGLEPVLQRASSPCIAVLLWKREQRHPHIDSYDFLLLQRQSHLLLFHRMRYLLLDNNHAQQARCIVHTKQVKKIILSV